MKVKRHKKVRRNLNFYKINFGIQAPYKILVDGEFLQAARDNQVQVASQLKTLCQEDTEVYVTRCVMEHLRKRGKEGEAAFFIGTKLKQLECKHRKGFLEQVECFTKLLGEKNEDHLCIGAQGSAMRRLVREKNGVPLFFLRGNVPVLETPGEDESKQVKDERQGLTEGEQQLLAKINPTEAKVVLHPKRKQPAQPNPLSMKKKKKTVEEQPKKRKVEEATPPAEAVDGVIDGKRAKKTRSRTKKKTAFNSC